ncbi:MAG: HlyC/CorC family transporter [Oscillospiraceae bacterium]|jgi:putative hemolysin
MSSDPGDAAIPLRLYSIGTQTAMQHPFLFAAILLFLIFAGAFFTAKKIAVLSLGQSQMKKLALEDDDKAKKLLALTTETARLLTGARTVTAVTGMLAAAVAAAGFAGYVEKLLSFLPISSTAAYIVSVILITLFFSCIWAVFADILPKKFVLSHSGTRPLRFAGIFSVFSRMFVSISSFLVRCVDTSARLFGVEPPASGQTVTQEEILLMMEAGRRSGLLNDDEKDMISNIFDFDETPVDEAMTHRTDVIAAEDTSSVEDVVAMAMENGYSRIPVYHEDLDHVIGIIYVKDLLPYVGNTIPGDLSLGQLMRPAYFVPKSKPCGELFTEMRLRRIQIAVVVDEYGGTEGIITMEDLLEAIVGNIQDEYDNEEGEIRRDGENRFDVEGTAPVDEVSEMLGIELPEGDYDTIAGLMMEYLGRLPKENEHPQVKIGAVTLTVAAMEDRRIAKILIEKDASSPEQQHFENNSELDE